MIIPSVIDTLFDATFVIKPLSLNDVAAMAIVETAAHCHPWSAAGLAECFGTFYRANGLYHATKDNELLGFSLVQQVVDEVSLLDICVSPAYQGKGYGKQLMLQLIEEAKHRKGAVLMLEVRESNSSALGLYSRLGFVQTARRKGYYPTGQGPEDAILMDLRF
jgi:ribosomal-protein-alanine N-acetyltransferase